MDENKICFICCVNDNMEYEESLLYLRNLLVPEGMAVDLLEIRDAASMAEGYQEGMNDSDAKYKVYLHQDVRIINPYFIQDVLQIFKADVKNGMIGMVGCMRMPSDGIMWHAKRVGNSINSIDHLGEYQVETDGWEEVEAIDGFLMVTQYDLPWRHELFDGWDFYDISQSLEFIKKGYRVVVPKRNGNWAVHEEKPCMSLWNYNRYRRIFLKNYSSMLGYTQTNS